MLDKAKCAYTNIYKLYMYKIDDSSEPVLWFES